MNILGSIKESMVRTLQVRRLEPPGEFGKQFRIVCLYESSLQPRDYSDIVLDSLKGDKR